MNTRSTLCLLTIVGSLAGCLDGRLFIQSPNGSRLPGGSTGDPDSPATPGGTVDGTTVTPDGDFVDATTECDGSTPARLWRLSHEQYDNTVADLLGTSLAPAEFFEPETSGTGFRNGSAAGFVSETLAMQYQGAAEALAAEAAGNLDNLVGCPPDDEACVRGFIDSFGRRAFRGPLSDEQRELYFGVYTAGAVDSPEFGVQLTIEAMLQSPHFLYRFELGGAAADVGTVASVSSHEMASQLSYLLWNTMPDERLLAAADDGSLFEPDVMQAEVERMLADPRSRRIFSEFFALYFGFERAQHLEKDIDMHPEFTAAVAASLASESATFVNHIAWDERGSIADLFTADYSFLNEDLAALYGVEGVEGDELRRVELPAGERAGLLTHAGVLALGADETSSSPTFRGLFVRSKLLCQHIAEPPADVNDDLGAPVESQTTRQRYEGHLTNTSCNGCHQLIDPIGFGFENYDAAGRYRTTENDVAIDASGEILGTQEIDGTFEGALELAERLSTSREVSDCVATHFFRFALGRLESSADACELGVMKARFAAYDQELLSLVGTVLASDAFRYREVK